MDMVEPTHPIPFDNDSIVICDLDGTLCDVEHRRHFVNGEKKNFDAFYELLVDDPRRENVYQMLLEFKMIGKFIVFVSGRPDRYREKTVEWLEDNGFPKKAYSFLLMRKDKDSRADDIVKEEIFKAFFEKEWIHKVIDDRPRVIRMWRKLKLDVIDVGDGKEF